jgi:3-methyl-2-oxobutanoate hydroxymethyltransferase
MKITTRTFIEKKKRGEKIVLVTAYDYPTALLADEVGMDGILVGDSLGMVIQGHDTTLPVTVEEMLYHTKIVRRAVKNALLITDMPFLSFQISKEDAIRNCGRMIKEGGAEAVKLEGGKRVVPLVRSLVEMGIPVMGHIGLTPQSVHIFGGYKVRGKIKEEIEVLKEDALILEEAGVFSLVLEGIPMEVAKEITDSLKIPTIGIGAGPFTDGQVLVFHDLVGFYEGEKPKFVKEYANIASIIKEALSRYIEEVKSGKFPDEAHSYRLPKKRSEN